MPDILRHSKLNFEGMSDPTIGNTIVLSIPLRYILGTIGKF